MKKRTMKEVQVLKKLGIPDFRHMTKDKVISFATMLPKMDPEVAKKALEQFPEFTKSLLDISQNYKETIAKSLDENSASNKAHYEMCNTIVNSLTTLLEKEELTESERADITDKLIILAQMVYDKDSENKEFIVKIVVMASGVAIGLAAIAATLLGSTSTLNSPNDDDTYFDDEDDEELL